MSILFSSTRSLRAAALVLLALPFAACVGESESEDLVEDAPIAQSEQAIEQDLTTLEAIQADPAFTAFYQTFREVQGPFTRAALGMTPARHDELVAGLQNIQCGNADCPALLTYLSSFGIQTNFTKLAQLLPMYHGLIARGASPVHLAKASVSAHGFDYELHPNDGSGYESSSDYGGCLNDCAAEFAWQTFLAYNTYISAMAACTATGPAWPICVASATIAFAWAIKVSTHSLEVCKEGCADAFGCGSGTGSCGSTSSTLGDACSYDSACVSGEHCGTLVQGVGTGVCQSDYARGHTCMRHGWCTSGTCSFAFCL